MKRIITLNSDDYILDNYFEKIYKSEYRINYLVIIFGIIISLLLFNTPSSYSDEIIFLGVILFFIIIYIILNLIFVVSDGNAKKKDRTDYMDDFKKKYEGVIVKYIFYDDYFEIHENDKITKINYPEIRAIIIDDLSITYFYENSGFIPFDCISHEEKIFILNEFRNKNIKEYSRKRKVRYISTPDYEKDIQERININKL